MIDDADDVILVIVFAISMSVIAIHTAAINDLVLVDLTNTHHCDFS